MKIRCRLFDAHRWGPTHPSRVFEGATSQQCTRCGATRTSTLATPSHGRSAFERLLDKTGVLNAMAEAVEPSEITGPARREDRARAVRENPVEYYTNGEGKR